MSQEKEIQFHIGGLPITSDVALAPMDGFSDQPFRSICRDFGSGFSITEFINVLDVPRRNNDLDKRIAFTDAERPIGFQIYGENPERILNSALTLLQEEPDFIDLNLGCAVRRIAGRGAGSGLLNEPKRIEEISRGLVNHIDIPVTAKIRLGWESDFPNYIETARILEGNGMAMISVHGRFRNQNWKSPALWEPIAQIKAAVSIPVIGNGDVRSPLDVKKMKQSTGCDGVMIGRAAVGNPWIFSGIDKNAIDKDQIYDMVSKHWEKMIGFYGIYQASILFRKHMKAYLTDSQFKDIDLKSILTSENPFQKFKELAQDDDRH